MKRYLLGCALLLALAGCASHAPRCGRRLTPINHGPIRPQPAGNALRPPAAHSRQAGRS